MKAMYTCKLANCTSNCWVCMSHKADNKGLLDEVMKTIVQWTYQDPSCSVKTYHITICCQDQSDYFGPFRTLLSPL